MRLLLKLGGFPEPFLSQSEREARRWSLDHRTRLVREDLSSLERFEDVETVEGVRPAPAATFLRTLV